MRAAHDKTMLRFNIELSDEDMKVIGEKMHVPVNFGYRPSREEARRFCIRAIEREIEKLKT